jgi:hypothetical protein
MRAERQLLSLGECLVRRACRRLPQETREDRYREWAAELPAILHDPQGGLAPWRAARMLAYAADTLRGSAMPPGGIQGVIARRGRAFVWLFLVFGLVGTGVSIWAIVLMPGDGQNYLQLAWTLPFVAYFASRLVHASARITTPLMFSFGLLLEVLSIWDAVQASRDWVNYANSAVLGLVLLAGVLAAFRTQWFRRLVTRARRT